ncbi:MAG TPA: GNAT family N-acetyltransferase [Allosphingosinicella sp.]|jgi:GNAT superfamily N-acetyltransferase
MTLVYRNAGPADAAAMAALGRRTFTDTFGHLYKPEDLAVFLLSHNKEGWARELADPAFAVRVAEAEGGPVAYAKLGPPSLPFEPKGHPIELRQFYVLQPWQGAGVATALMDWAIAEAGARGADELYLSVFTDNHRARRFYDRYGFTFVQTYAFMVGSHADEDHILRLDLKEPR